MPSLQHLFQHLDDFFQSRPVLFRETAHIGTVNIQHAPDRTMDSL